MMRDEKCYEQLCTKRDILTAVQHVNIGVEFASCSTNFSVSMSDTQVHF